MFGIKKQEEIFSSAGNINIFGDDPASTGMNAGIACHSGFCLFQPVRKKHSLISAKNNTLASLKAGFERGALKARFAVNSAARSFSSASSYAVAA